MDIYRTCEVCGSEITVGQKCDTCGLELNQGTPITVSFGYGSGLDNETYHFCSTEHALEFLTAELQKEKK